MNILAFDTCLDMCSVAAGRGLRSLTPRIAANAEAMKVGHAERLMPMIEQTLAEAGMRPADLHRIAVTNGPGTFAGTRIAVSAARALALATGADVVAVSSLNLLAMHPEIPGRHGRQLVIATDAHRDELYMQQIDRRTLRPSAPPQVVPLADVAAFAGIAPVTFAGSGANLALEAARQRGLDAEAVGVTLMPDAFDMLFAAFEMKHVADVMPLYLRPPDAKPPPPSPFVGSVRRN